MDMSGNDVVRIGLLVGDNVLDQSMVTGLAARGVDCRISATLTEAERGGPGDGYDLLVVDAAIYGSESPAACRRLVGNWPDCPLLLLTDPGARLDESSLEPAWMVMPISDRKTELLPSLLLLVAERLISAADSAASRAVLKTVLEVVGDGLTLTDNDGVPLYENPAMKNHAGVYATFPLQDEQGNCFGSLRRSASSDQVHAYEPARDPGTGLVCREVMVECLGHALARVGRSGGRCAVLLVDYLGGEPAGGDQAHLRAALNVAGRKLSYKLRRGDLVARIAPGSFAVILEGVDTVAETARVAQKLLQDIPFGDAERARIGIAISPEDGDKADDLMVAAEAALMEARKSEAPRYAYKEQATADRIARFLALSEGLDRALKRDEFSLHFQPQFDLASRVVTGFEALLRWQHADLGPVSPAEFVPVMERNGLINEAGAWVIETACRQLATWQKKFDRPDLSMAVNLSPSQLEDDALISVVKRALDASGVAPAALELEVTEGLLMKDPEHAGATLRRLTRMGIPIAIDDFGTGYSSLGYLKRLPVSALKIDRSFMQGVPEHEKDISVVKGTIALAKGLDLVVTAEGVETQDQLECLHEYACDRVQGFLFGKPRAAAEAERFLVDGPNV